MTKGPHKEIGWHPVCLTEHGENDTLFSSFPKEVIVFQWHGDTFDLPDRAVRLFSPENYQLQLILDIDVSNVYIIFIHH